MQIIDMTIPNAKKVCIVPNNTERSTVIFNDFKKVHPSIIMNEDYSDKLKYNKWLAQSHCDLPLKIGSADYFPM